MFCYFGLHIQEITVVCFAISKEGKKHEFCYFWSNIHWEKMEEKESVAKSNFSTNKFHRLKIKWIERETESGRYFYGIKSPKWQRHENTKQSSTKKLVEMVPHRSGRKNLFSCVENACNSNVIVVAKWCLWMVNDWNVWHEDNLDWNAISTPKIVRNSWYASVNLRYNAAGFVHRSYQSVHFNENMPTCNPSTYRCV